MLPDGLIIEPTPDPAERGLLMAPGNRLLCFRLAEPLEDVIGIDVSVDILYVEPNPFPEAVVPMVSLDPGALTLSLGRVPPESEVLSRRLRPPTARRLDLAEAWIPEIRFHELERFHPVDVSATLTVPQPIFDEMTEEDGLSWNVGGYDGILDHSPPWRNKTARYFRRFVRSDNVASDGPIVD